MKIFGLKPQDEIPQKYPTVVDPSGEPESLRDLIKRKFVPEDRTLPSEDLKVKLHGAIREASDWFSTKIEGMPDSVLIDSVEVELGVTIGGEVGLFAKGRADIAASFTVTLKPGSGSSKVASQGNSQ